MHSGEHLQSTKGSGRRKLLVKPKTGRGRTMMEATGMRKRSSAED
jgi:hypothetical protein